MLVFLAGEGPHELGAWAGDPAYRSATDFGVVEELLRRVARRQFTVQGAVVWRSIRKYRAGQHRSAEERNVLGAALMAAKLAVIFSSLFAIATETSQGSSK